MRMYAFNLNTEAFQNVDADLVDTIQTNTVLRMRYGHITDRTNRYGRAICSICRIRIFVCDWGLSLLKYLDDKRVKFVQNQTIRKDSKSELSFLVTIVICIVLIRFVELFLNV